MGLWPGDVHYERRYQYAREYVDILKLLWTRCDLDYDEELPLGLNPPSCNVVAC